MFIFSKIFQLLSKISPRIAFSGHPLSEKTRTKELSPAIDVPLILLHLPHRILYDITRNGTYKGLYLLDEIVELAGIGRLFDQSFQRKNINTMYFVRIFRFNVSDWWKNVNFSAKPTPKILSNFN
jgi:hypothetical protein